MMNRGMKILDRPQLKDLKYKIQNAINYFVGDVLGIVQNFQITTSWVNKTDKSEYIDKHSHPNSIISGVYYVSTTPKCAPIIFSKPHLYANITFQNIQLAYSGDNKNQYNTDYFGINHQLGNQDLPNQQHNTEHFQLVNHLDLYLVLNLLFPLCLTKQTKVMMKSNPYQEL